MMKKAIALMVCLLMALPLFTACGDPAEKETSTADNATGAASEADTTSAEDEKLSAIKDEGINAGAYKDEFTILALTDVGHSFDEIYAESESGETLDSAVYTRNQAFSNLWGIPVTVIESTSGAIQTTVAKSVQSTPDEFQLVMPRMNEAAMMAQSGTLYSFLELGSVDLAQGWWDPGTASFVLADSIFFMNGAINYMDDNCTYLMMFNKDRYKNLGFTESPYDLVSNGTWTMDKFYSLMKDASEDNGNGVKDEEDYYGFVSTTDYPTTFFYGAGLSYVVCKEGEDPAIAIDSTMTDKISDLMTKTTTLFYTKNATWQSKGGEEQIGKGIFKNGHGLFYGEVASYIIDLNKDMKENFGIIPVPKYDEAQDNYWTWTNAICTTAAIPSNITNPDTVGAMVESYAIYSQKYVTVAYYDIVLSRRSVRDEESSVMLDLIFSHRIYDFAMYYDIGFRELFRNSVNANNGTYASSFASASKSAPRRLASMLAKFDK